MEKILKCWMVRHGRVETNGKMYGARDVPCLPIQREDTAFLRRCLPNREKAHYVTSSLQRTHQTLKAIDEHAYNKSTQEACLNEQSLGVLEGVALDTLQDQQEWQNLLQDFSRYRPSEGENLQDVVQRVGRYLENLTQQWVSGGEEEEHYVFVVHAGVIRAALIHCLGLDITKAMQFDVTHLSVSVFEYRKLWLFDDFGWRLLSWNEGCARS